MSEKIRLIGIAALMTILVACDSGSPATQAQAENYIAQGDYRNAMLILKNIIQSKPEDQAARLLLGAIYLPVGDGASAEKELRRAQELGVPTAHITADLAKALLLQGKIEEALDTAKPISNASDSVNAEILSVRGNALFAKGKIEDAVATYRRALDLEELTILALQGLIKVTISKNDIEKKNLHLEKLIIVAPDDATTWLLEGAILARQEKMVDAEQSFLKAVDLLNEKQMTRNGFSVYIGLAQTQLRQHKLDKALINVKKLRASYPSHPVPRYMRALIAFEQKDYKLSLEQLTEILREVPSHIPSQLLAGTVHYAIGNYEQSREQLKRVVNKVPNHLQARKLLAAVYLKQKNPKDALEVLQTKETSNTTDAQLLAMMGKAAMYSGDYTVSLAMYKKALKNSPEATGIRTELAQLYLRKGAYGDAVTELEEIKGKGKLQAKRMKIYALIRDKKYDQAIATTQELAIEHPGDPLIPTTLGAIELSRGERDKARRLFLKARDLQPDYVAALLSLAELDLAEGHLDKADAWYNEIILKDSKSLRALLGMAQIEERRGQTDQALAWVQKASKENPKAISPVAILINYHIKARRFELVDKIVNNVDKSLLAHPGLLKLRAKSLIAQGKTHEAIAVINELIKLQPTNVRNYLQLAQVYSSVKNAKKVRDSLLRAKKIAPNTPAVIAALVQVEIRLGNLDNALKIISEQKKLPKSHSFAYVLEGDVYAQQKQYKKAEAAYKKGMAIDDIVSLSAKLAIVQYEAGDHIAARSVIVNWVSKHPKNVEGQSVLAQVYMQINMQREAMALYERINQLAPNNPVVLNNLAWLYSENNDSRALGIAEQAYLLATTSSSIMDTYGWLLVQKGELTKGIDILREAATMSAGQHPEILLHLATALMKKGGDDAEVGELVKLLQANGRLKNQEELRRLVSKL